MKWSRWIVFSLASFGAVAANAVEPRLNAPRLARVPVTPARYAVDDPAVPTPATAAPRAAITPHAPVHYRSATWDIWSGTATGYVYSPGACDYTPPCVNHLWDGYVQTFHRCHPVHMHGHHCRMHGCDACGSAGGVFAGCDSCGSGSSCGCGGHASLLKRAHGWHFGGKVYGGCYSCGSIAPSCGCDAIDGKSYDNAPSPAPAPPAPSDAVAPPTPMPTADSDLPDYEAPALEKAARGKQRLRGYTWPENSLQR